MVISLNLKLLANLCGTEYFEIQVGFKKKGGSHEDIARI